MRALKAKIMEALVSTLPVTVIVYILSLTPVFNFSTVELITFTVGAVLLILGIGMFSLGADLAMTPMGTHVGAHGHPRGCGLVPTAEAGPAAGGLLRAGRADHGGRA